MIPVVAWRNIWRNKLRSIILLFSIALGLWAGIFAISISNGLNHQRLTNIIDNQLSHIQFHHPEFRENNEVDKTIDNSESIVASIRKDPNVKGISNRTIVSGMIQSARSTKPVMVKGVKPSDEANVTALNTFMTDGNYLEDESKSKIKPILLGKALAEDLGVGVKKRVVVKFINADNEVVQELFKVKGIYQTNDSRNDVLSVYVPQNELNNLLSGEAISHELAVYLKDDSNIDAITDNWAEQFPDVKVESWKQLFPGLEYANTVSERANMLLLGIIMLALSFGIINTMLMSVLERVKEFGMLMAVGMNKTKVFSMIMLETVMLMLTALPVGLFLAWLTVSILSKTGIDFSDYAEGFNNVGVEAVVYPLLSYDYYPKIILLVIFAAIISAIYPAVKAIRLNPAEAIRKL